MEHRSDEAVVADTSQRPTPPPRPLPDLALSERLAAWGAWFGLPRLVATAVCMLVVAGGGYWLVRAPAPSTDAGLPRSVAGVAATLPEPVPSSASPRLDGTSPLAPTEVVVHVAGEVGAPGVYVLVGAPRVHDAIDAAGGPTGDADLDALNLAAVIIDGQRLYVPVLGDVEPGAVVLPEPAVAAPGSGGVAPPSAERPIDLNRATASELDALPGVGPATARAIVDDRERNGPFARVDDLERVPGIGPAKLAALRDLVAA